MGQLGRTYPRFCRNGIINFSNIFDFFLRGPWLHKFFFWSYRNHSVCSYSRPYRPKRCYCGWLPIYVTGWLSIYICMSHFRVPTPFPQWPSHPLWSLLFRKANHFTMITLNILFDKSPGNVQSRFRRPLNFSANVTHAHCILGSSRKTHIGMQSRRSISVVCWKFGTNVMQIAKFLKFQVGIISLDSQDPRILEICNKSRATGWFIRSCVSLLSEQFRACCVGY